MARCERCGDGPGRSRTCAFCGEEFCREHRRPADHGCPGADGVAEADGVAGAEGSHGVAGAEGSHGVAGAEANRDAARDRRPRAAAQVVDREGDAAGAGDRPTLTGSDGGRSLAEWVLVALAALFVGGVVFAVLSLVVLWLLLGGAY